MAALCEWVAGGSLALVVTIIRGRSSVQLLVGLDADDVTPETIEVREACLCERDDLSRDARPAETDMLAARRRSDEEGVAVALGDPE